MHSITSAIIVNEYIKISTFLCSATQQPNHGMIDRITVDTKDVVALPSCNADTGYLIR